MHKLTHACKSNVVEWLWEAWVFDFFIYSVYPWLFPLRAILRNGFYVCHRRFHSTQPAEWAPLQREALQMCLSAKSALPKVQNKLCDERVHYTTQCRIPKPSSLGLLWLHSWLAFGSPRRCYNFKFGRAGAHPNCPFMISALSYMPAVCKL